MRYVFAIVAAALLLMQAPAARANQKDPRLGALFEQLQHANSPQAAAGAEATIWTIWLRSDDDEVNALMARGIAAMNTRRFDVALAAFNRIIELAPDFAEGWNKRATLYYLMQRYDESVSDIAHTLELEPRHFGALSGLGLINDALGRTQAAIEAWQQALAVNPFLIGAKERIRALKQKQKGEKL
jgi:tetratricopeptide (TPR) repeat protein